MVFEFVRVGQEDWMGMEGMKAWKGTPPANVAREIPMLRSVQYGD